jgi:hypothetical protein
MLGEEFESGNKYVAQKVTESTSKWQRSCQDYRLQGVRDLDC